KIEGSVYIANIKINPHVEIYLDSEGITLEVVPLNEDGNVILEGLELIGQEYSTALRQVIDSAYEKEFLQEGNDVVLTPYTKGDAPVDVYNDTYLHVMEEFMNNTGIHVNVEMEGIIAQQGETQIVVGNEDPVINDHVVATHDNGKPAQTREEDSNGTIIVKDFDDTGKVLREELQFQSGEVIITEEDSRGLKVESHYDSQGDLESQVVFSTHPDGSIQQDHYDREGILAVTMMIDPSGNETIIEHTQQSQHNEPNTENEAIEQNTSSHEPSIVYGQVYTTYNGDTRIETIYNADGTTVRTEHYSNGTYNTKYIDANGQKTREVFTDTKGWYYDLTPYPSGRTYIDIHVSPDGTYTKQRYKENGDNIDFYFEYTDGITEYRVANDNGSVASITISGPGDYYFESKHDSNGVIQSGYERKSDGSEVYQSFHSNGARKEEKWYFPDGLVVINTFDVSGNLINTENILPVVE
ncbi:MAG: hypothetical protein IJP28_03860, partial [Erysipelotrichales bacterium]|nr:hypothetical protein [Erysipelotrichales bacterium]